MKPREIMTTRDGSHSLYVPELDEHYHSSHGALQESQHVFIEMGLKFLDDQEVNLFEVGFGTGLNAWLTWLHREDREVRYTTLEKYPLQPAEWQALNYTALTGGDPAEFAALHESAWENPVVIDPRFELCKLEDDLRTVDLPNDFNLVYYDAFAPNVQPHLWTIDVLKRVVGAMKSGGVLVTYCAKGQLRRDLQALGMEVERLPGPPGKREMLRAVRA